MSKNSSKGVPMTQKDASRIQSTNAKQGGGQTQKGSFTARAQSAADRNPGGSPKR